MVKLIRMADLTVRLKEIYSGLPEGCKLRTRLLKEVRKIVTQYDKDIKLIEAVERAKTKAS